MSRWANKTDRSVSTTGRQVFRQTDRPTGIPVDRFIGMYSMWADRQLMVGWLVYLSEESRNSQRVGAEGEGGGEGGGGGGEGGGGGGEGGRWRRGRRRLRRSGFIPGRIMTDIEAADECV